jgi:hypothetical protein
MSDIKKSSNGGFSQEAQQKKADNVLADNVLADNVLADKALEKAKKRMAQLARLMPGDRIGHEEIAREMEKQASIIRRIDPTGGSNYL